MAQVRIDYNESLHHFWAEGDVVDQIGATPALSITTSDNTHIVLRVFATTELAEDAYTRLVGEIAEGLKAGGTTIVIDTDDY